MFRHSTSSGSPGDADGGPAARVAAKIHRALCPVRGQEQSVDIGRRTVNRAARGVCESGNDDRDGGHSPGMHRTSGSMSRLRFENVCNPEQPLKSCSSVMLVTASSGEIVKAMGLPCAVVPLHGPA